MDLAQLVEETAARQRPIAEARQQTITVHTGGAAWISGERSSLRRLVWSLLDNAVKYTPARGSIVVGLIATPSEAALTVRDSGIGIPEEPVPFTSPRDGSARTNRSKMRGSTAGCGMNSRP